MREIKFRVWDLDNKEWYYSPQLVVRPYSGSVTDGATTPNVVLSQYTGIKDIRNTDIYEGDIVEFARGRHQVRFVDGSFALCDRNQWHIPFYTVHGGIEVIGNIYENPELI